MTKKHFEALAAINKRAYTDAFDASARLSVIDVILAQADHFQSTHERFNRTTFLAACGL